MSSVFQLAPDDLVAGVRDRGAESIRLDGGIGRLHGTVVEVEPMGRETLYLLESELGQIRALDPVGIAGQVGFADVHRNRARATSATASARPHSCRSDKRRSLPAIEPRRL